MLRNVTQFRRFPVYFSSHFSNKCVYRALCAVPEGFVPHLARVRGLSRRGVDVELKNAADRDAFVPYKHLCEMLSKGAIHRLYEHSESSQTESPLELYCSPRLRKTADECYRQLSMALYRARGFLPITDATESGIILEQFNMTKTQFRRALGKLRNSRKIRVLPMGIQLVPREERVIIDSTRLSRRQRSELMAEQTADDWRRALAVEAYNLPQLGRRTLLADGSGKERGSKAVSFQDRRALPASGKRRSRATPGHVRGRRRSGVVWDDDSAE